MLSAVLIVSAIMVPIQFVFSSYSDKHGRKGIFMLGATSCLYLGFCHFSSSGYWKLLVNSSCNNRRFIFLAMMYGPQAAFFTELFSTEVDIQVQH